MNFLILRKYLVKYLGIKGHDICCLFPNGLKEVCLSSLVAQQVENPALSLQRLRSLLWCGFNPWPETYCGCSQKKKKNAGVPTVYVSTHTYLYVEWRMNEKEVCTQCLCVCVHTHISICEVENEKAVCQNVNSGGVWVKFFVPFLQHLCKFQIISK